MLAACEAELPVDIAVCTAAVADWRPESLANQKIKKSDDGVLPVIRTAENPDILASLSHASRRPALVVGFAAETEHVVAYAQAKRVRKGCDWIVANDVSPGTGIMGGDQNRVHLITTDRVEDWPLLDKNEVARRLVARIAQTLPRRSA
jgi:phosphopantothenoylcysteine decarboxylase/phosphopantothenate--cysteine ligase